MKKFWKKVVEFFKIVSEGIDKTQYKKIKWVNKNIKPVEIIIVDKRKNKLIKKETE